MKERLAEKLKLGWALKPDIEKFKVTCKMENAPEPTNTAEETKIIEAWMKAYTDRIKLD